MHIHVVTLFPDLIAQAMRWGVIGRALARGQWGLECFSPRTYSSPPHFTVDDRPYGGGPGMVMLDGPLSSAIAHAHKALNQDESEDQQQAQHYTPRILLSPSGAPFTQSKARQLCALKGFVLVCGRYEGVDARTIARDIDEEISVGDYVLSGGEFAALTVIDATARLLPGVLGDPQSSVDESFSFGLLDFPHYTRPEVLSDGQRVPSVLTTGDHAKIEDWRRKQVLTNTFNRRPDLIAKAAGLSPSDIVFLRQIGYTGRLPDGC